MVHFTRIFGVSLIVLGLISYFGTGMVSITALIPAFLGIVFFILGIAARKESIYKYVMHGAVLLAFLGLAGSITGLVKAFFLIGGDTVERPNAVIAQAVTAILCIIFIGAAIKSFIDARKAREA